VATRPCRPGTKDRSHLGEESVETRDVDRPEAVDEVTYPGGEHRPTDDGNQLVGSY